MKGIAGGVAGACFVLYGCALILGYLVRNQVPASQTLWSPAPVAQMIVGLVAVAVGYVIASRRPGSPIGWLALAATALLALSYASNAYALRALLAAPGSLPGGQPAMWVRWVSGLVPIPCLGFILLLFPDGRLPGPRWRLVAWFAAAIFAWVTVVAMVGATLVWSHPFVSVYRVYTPGPFAKLWFPLPAAIAVCAAAVVVRFIRSAGEERLQLTWFAAAAALVGIAAIPRVATNSPVSIIALDVAIIGLEAAIVIAVLRYRLYDIDIVINRALLYASLAAFITAVYFGLVTGVGTLAGHQGDPLLAAAAAAVVALAFQPVRQRAGRLANRVVYGRRATPYQVLSDFGRRIGRAYSTEEVLPQMTRVVAAGTGAERVVIWLRAGDELRAVTSSDDSLPTSLAGLAGVSALPGADVSVPVMHRGELLGAIAIAMPKSEPLRPAGRQLVEDVASQAGLVLHNVGLVEDLRASRQRLVAAQDEARRRLEQNLHDGAQQDLVALVIKARLAAQAIEDVAQGRAALDELRTDATTALDNLRDLARGIYPPLLADLGLAAALNAQAKKSALPVTVQADALGRFPEDIEAAVYFCCLEALQNTAKYARASQATVTLRAENGTLTFAVSDDGAGFDAGHTALGAGLRNMADRLAALGGSLEVTSAAGQGTTVTGHIPDRIAGGSS